MPAPHLVEFRRRAAELARRREKPIARLAKDLGISETCLRNWMAVNRPGVSGELISWKDGSHGTFLSLSD